MKNLKAVLAKTFQTNSFLLNKAVKDMSEEHITKRPNDNTNPIQFLIGHITLYRYHACKLLGNEMKYKHTEHFQMGAQPKDASNYPSVAEMVAEWNVISKKLDDILESSSEEDLANAFEHKYPIGEQNIGGAMSFIMFHESYHIGQIAYIRKFMGYDTLVG